MDWHLDAGSICAYNCSTRHPFGWNSFAFSNICMQWFHLHIYRSMAKMSMRSSYFDESSIILLMFAVLYLNCLCIVHDYLVFGCCALGCTIPLAWCLWFVCGWVIARSRYQDLAWLWYEVTSTKMGPNGGFLPIPHFPIIILVSNWGRNLSGKRLYWCQIGVIWVGKD